ncbi:MAG: hypothetical protein QOC59_1742, partial [Microbacteriaceae bacterium]|nr:hypothetical protein [Microbacteriaceae bacterium]
LTYEPPLTADALISSLERSAERESPAPELRGRDWAPIVDAHVEAFRSAVRAR